MVHLNHIQCIACIEKQFKVHFVQFYQQGRVVVFYISYELAWYRFRYPFLKVLTFAQILVQNLCLQFLLGFSFFLYKIGT